ncbi:MAG: CBS domain-containing protein [Thalassobaculum sp.]
MPSQGLSRRQTAMQAKDIMTTAVATVPPETTVQDVAKLLLERRISAVPVVDGDGKVLGIVSEGDLMRRPETGTERHPSWWLSLLDNSEERALEYVRSHGGTAGDVMTRDVRSVDENATLEEIAEKLERHHIKRVPVLRGDRLVGIVSRADLLRGLVARRAAPAVTASDDEVKKAVEAAILEAGAGFAFLSVVVSGGVVHIWGSVGTEVEKRAAGMAAEGVPGVKSVRNEIGILPPRIRAMMWGQ